MPVLSGKAARTQVLDFFSSLVAFVTDDYKIRDLAMRALSANTDDW